MRKTPNIGYNPLVAGKGSLRANAYQGKDASDFQVIEMDDDEDENIDIGGGRARPQLHVATRKLEQARAAKKRQKVVSSQIENLDYGRDEQVAEISPTKNNFHRFAKGADGGKNDFAEAYKEESLGDLGMNEKRRAAHAVARPKD